MSSAIEVLKEIRKGFDNENIDWQVMYCKALDEALLALSNRGIKGRRKE